MQSHLKDLEEVRALIQLYIDGANGDVDKLKAAFHPDARMMGHVGPMDTYIPITDFFRMIEVTQDLAGPNYQAYVRNIDLAGDAGVAVLVETDYMGCDFVDYFSVARIGAAAGRSPTRPTPTPAGRHRASEGVAQKTGARG